MAIGQRSVIQHLLCCSRSRWARGMASHFRMVWETFLFGNFMLNSSTHFCDNFKFQECLSEWGPDETVIAFKWHYSDSKMMNDIFCFSRQRPINSGLLVSRISFEFQRNNFASKLLTDFNFPFVNIQDENKISFGAVRLASFVFTRFPNSVATSFSLRRHKFNTKSMENNFFLFSANIFLFEIIRWYCCVSTVRSFVHLFFFLLLSVSEHTKVPFLFHFFHLFRFFFFSVVFRLSRRVALQK